MLFYSFGYLRSIIVAAVSNLVPRGDEECGGSECPSVDRSDLIPDSLQVGVGPRLTIVDCAKVGCVHISPVGGNHWTAAGEGQWIGRLASRGTPYSYVAIIIELHSDKNKILI